MCSAVNGGGWSVIMEMFSHMFIAFDSIDEFMNVELFGLVSEPGSAFRPCENRIG